MVRCLGLFHAAESAVVYPYVVRAPVLDHVVVAPEEAVSCEVLYEWGHVLECARVRQLQQLLVGEWCGDGMWYAMEQE